MAIYRFTRNVLLFTAILVLIAYRARADQGHWPLVITSWPTGPNGITTVTPPQHVTITPPPNTTVPPYVTPIDPNGTPATNNDSSALDLNPYGSDTNSDGKYLVTGLGMGAFNAAFEEPTQQAVIAWNGTEEMLVLMTQQKSTLRGEGAMLSCIPLPGEPLSAQKGDSCCAALENRHMRSASKSTVG